jgi:hypothetical protein
MSEKHGSIMCIRLPYKTRYFTLSIFFLIFLHKFSPFVLSAMNSVWGLFPPRLAMHCRRNGQSLQSPPLASPKGKPAAGGFYAFFPKKIQNPLDKAKS